jgi:hypothetical protein
MQRTGFATDQFGDEWPTDCPTRAHNEDVHAEFPGSMTSATGTAGGLSDSTGTKREGWTPREREDRMRYFRDDVPAGHAQHNAEGGL